MTLTEAAQLLGDAMRSLGDVRVYEDLSARVDPPGIVIGLPALSWGAMCPDAQPTQADFPLWVIAAMNSRAQETLWGLMPRVIEALEASGLDAVVPGGASATPYNSGGTDLPSYQLTVEVPL